jgi:predicted metal-dependent hydrolase
VAQSDTEVEQPRVLRLLKDDIIFAEKDEDLHKYILQQHQTAVVQQVVARAHRPTKRRGLVWHTQGSGNTFTMLKTAELLFNTELLDLDEDLGDYVIVHELLHFRVPNHGKLWKSLMRAHLGDYERQEERLKRIAPRVRQ